jgi:hypothetical protein
VRSVRLLAALAALLASSTPADAERELASAELRLGYGLATGGGAGRASVRSSPLVVSATGALAIRDQPRLYGYAGLLIETLDRTGVGGETGVMVIPDERLRLRAGAIAIAEPYTIWGAVVGASVCRRFGGMRGCADLSGDFFVGGTDLPARTVAFQLLVGVGVVFDVQ